MSFASVVSFLRNVNLSGASLLRQASGLQFASYASKFSLSRLATGFTAGTNALHCVSFSDGQEGDQVTFSDFSLNFDTQEGDQ